MLRRPAFWAASAFPYDPRDARSSPLCGYSNEPKTKTPPRHGENFATSFIRGDVGEAF
jgi:hypothetical protein